MRLEHEDMDNGAIQVVIIIMHTHKLNKMIDLQSSVTSVVSVVKINNVL